MVDKYIKELLIEHGRVYIPDFALIYKDYKSNASSDTYTLSQPKPHFLIDGEYRNEDDTWLAYAVARGEHSTLEDAEGLIRNRVEDIKSQLNSGYRVELEEVGSVYSESDTLTLENSSSLVSAEQDNSYGVPERISVEIEDEPIYNQVSSYSDTPSYESSYNETPSYETNDSTYSYQDEDRYKEERANDGYEERANDEYNTSELSVEEPLYPEPEEDLIPEYEYKEKEKKSSKIVWMAAAAAVLMLTFGAFYYFYLRPQAGGEDELVASENVLNSTEDEEAVPTEDSTMVAEASMGATGVNATTGAKSLSTPEKGKRYYIIAGAFSVNENAQKLKRQLRSKGISAKVIRSKDSQELYRVSLADFDNFDQALSKTENFKNEHGSSIWILKY